ncbi:MAG: SH3 domain-containing protein, partial [Clostridia bacterium]|nr:SH3 domain-containing protein [Clostridia bacterium]
LYTVLGGETLKLAETTGAKRLTSAKDGTNLYVLKDECIEIYSTNGTLLSTLTHDFTNVKDISVDYAGQIFALREDGFDVFINDSGTPTISSSTEFYNATAYAKANSLCVENNSLYFSTLECLIGKSTVTAYNKDTFKPASFVPSADAIYHFAKLKEDTFSYIIPVSGRMEAISPAPTETVLVFDNDGSDWANALLNGEFFKIKQSDYDVVEIEELVGDYAAKNNTTLYAMPNVNNGKVAVLAGTRFTLISDCADFENSKWLRVNYNEKTYFVLSDDCDEFIELIRDEDRVYGKAKAKRVGGLVNVYADASSDAEVLLSIVDGTEIEVLDKLDRYYMVRYGNTVGYMLKGEVELDGLTTVQIIAIVVACLVAVAGVGIFIAIETTKKKAAEAERRAERKQK